MRSVRKVLLLLILISIVALLFATQPASAACTGDSYDGAGNWNVNQNTTCKHMTITVHGNIMLGAFLTLNNVTLRMNSTTDGEFKIQDTNTDAGFVVANGTNISAVNSSAKYVISFENGAEVDMRDSYISDAGGAGENSEYGMSMVSILNMTFRNCANSAVKLTLTTTGTIANNTFTNVSTAIDLNGVSSTEISGNNIQHISGTGISVSGGAANLSYNVINKAGGWGILITNDAVVNAAGNNVSDTSERVFQVTDSTAIMQNNRLLGLRPATSIAALYIERSHVTSTDDYLYFPDCEVIICLGSATSVVNFTAMNIQIDGNEISTGIEMINHSHVVFINSRMLNVGESLLSSYPWTTDVEITVHGGNLNSTGKCMHIDGQGIMNLYDVDTSGCTGEVFLNNSAVLLLVNTSWDQEIKIYGSAEYRKAHHVDVYVANTTGDGMANANVSATDNDQNVLFSVLTNSSGHIARNYLIEFVNYSTGIADFKSNYTINASLTGYYVNSTSINATRNFIGTDQINIILTAVTPSEPTTPAEEAPVEVVEKAKDYGPIIGIGIAIIVFIVIVGVIFFSSKK